MNNPLIITVENELSHLGIENAKLIRNSYNEKNFGNAEAVYELKNLRLYFIRDRGQDLLNISSVTSPENYYPFCDLSLAMGWESLSEITTVTKPISLNKALEYIKNDLEELNYLFSAQKILSTHAKLKDAERKRVKAMFS